MNNGISIRSNILSLDKLCFVFCFMVCILSIVHGQNIIIKPYLQNVDSASVIIMWETDDVGPGSAEWGDSPFTLVNTVNSTTQVGNGNSRIHTTIIQGLHSDSKYYYKVLTDSGSSSSVYNFRTKSNVQNETSTKIVAMSDMQRDGSNPDVFSSMIIDGIFPVLQNPNQDINDQLDAILIPGDLVPTGGSYNQWKDYFFSQADSILPYVPIYPVLGNHEYISGGKDNFVKYFNLPKNGKVENPDEWWYKDISNTRIIGLNSNAGQADQDSQLVWLQTILDQTTNEDHIDFVFAQLHHPYKSELWTPGENDFTGEIIEIMENFTEVSGKPSLHFFGHTHAYSRGQSRDHQHLWINVATAGGAIDNWGEFPNQDYEEFVKSQDEYGFVLLDIVAGDMPSFNLKRYSRGDSNTPLDNVIRDEIQINRYDPKPSTPVCLYPFHEEVNPICFEMQASHFEDMDGDEHQASQWQISTDSLNFDSNLVYNEWKQSENWYNEINTQANDTLRDELSSVSLAPDAEYFWRVRYRDEHLVWSDWSDKINFTTSSSTYISGNLVLNHEAEDGVIHWSGDIESLLSNECQSVPAYIGDRLFAIGGVCANEMAYGVAEQLIDVAGFQTQISQGNIVAEFGAYMRNFGGPDNPQMSIELLDINQNIISISNTLSNPQGIWLNKTDKLSIPVNCRYIKVILEGIRNAGTDNDSYIDAVSVQLVESSTCSLYEACPQTRILSSIVGDQSQIATSLDSIISTSKIQGASNVRYETGSIIELNAGFEALLGSQFITIFKPCVD